MKLAGKKLLVAVPMAWLSGCSLGPFTGLGHAERVISLQPTHVLLASAPKIVEGGIISLGNGVSTADLKSASSDPEEQRLIQLTALRRRFSRSTSSSTSAAVAAVTGEQQASSDGWDKIFQSRRESRRNRTVARSESRVARPDRATLAEIEKIEKAAREEASRVEKQALAEAEIAERRLKAEADLAERIALAQAKLAERLAAAQEERAFRVSAAEAERDLKLSFLGMDMTGKDGASLNKQLDILGRHGSSSIARGATPPAKPSTSSRIAGLFHGEKTAASEKAAVTAGALAMAASSGAAQAEAGKSAAAKDADPSLARLAASVAPADAGATSGPKLEFSFTEPQAFPSEAAPALAKETNLKPVSIGGETLHPSLLEIPLETPAPKDTTVARTETPAAPAGSLFGDAPASSSGAWLLGRSEDELVPESPAPAVAQADSPPAALPSKGPSRLTPVVAASASSHDEPAAFPIATSTSSGLFSDPAPVPAPIAVAEKPETNSLLPFTTGGLLDSLASSGDSSSLLPDAASVLQPDLIPQALPEGPVDVSQPPAVADMRIIPAEIHGMQPVELMPPNATPPAKPGWTAPTLVDVCGPLPAPIKSLVLQLDIPEAGIRKAVLADLAALGPEAKGAIPAIHVLLEDDPLVAAHAAWTIWEIDHDDQAVIRELVGLMQCGRKDVVQFAAYSLGSMGANALTATEALRIERERQSGITRLHVAEALTRIDAFDGASVQVLVQGLSSPLQSERWLSAIALGQVKPRHADLVVSSLASSLKDQDPEVRSAAALSLGGFGKAATPALAELQNRANLDAPSVREAAATALACIRRQDQSANVW